MMEILALMKIPSLMRGFSRGIKALLAHYSDVIE